jgi:hypothetical protein
VTAKSSTEYVTDSLKDSKESAEVKAAGWGRKRSNYSRGGGGLPRKGPSGLRRGSQKRSPSLYAQASSPSAQVKAAAAQVVGLN